MSSFEPLINLLLLLSVLSMAAERLTNVLKLRRARMRVALASEAEEKKRERDIGEISLLVSILVAVLVKADLFEILGRLDAPWDTIGWVRVNGTEWVRSSALSGAASFLYAVGGSLLTGIALGFGSKFWHELLDIVLKARESLKRLSERAPETGTSP